jgi:hypothetical protein
MHVHLEKKLDHMASFRALRVTKLRRVNESEIKDGNALKMFESRLINLAVKAPFKR